MEEHNSYVLFSDNTSETFETNSALNGGAICSSSNITFKEYSTMLFKNNTVYIDGGAVSIFTNSSFTVNDYNLLLTLLSMAERCILIQPTVV